MIPNVFGAMLQLARQSVGILGTDKKLFNPTPEFLRPRDASEYLLTRWAIRATFRTLARYRVEGVGPRFRTAGRDIVYARDQLDAWASSKLSAQDFGSTARLSDKPRPAS